MRHTLSKARKNTSIATQYAHPGRRSGRIAAAAIGAGLAVTGLTVVASPAHAAAKPDSFAETNLIATRLPTTRS
jgi:predicted alpha/beta-hydrolase family hydrolase